MKGLPHLVLDTSHAAVARHDLIAVRKLFGKRLRHVHLSDNAGKGWDSHLPPGEGVLDLDAFLEDLAAFGVRRRGVTRGGSPRLAGSPGELEATMVGMRERTELALASAGRSAR